MVPLHVEIHVIHWIQFIPDSPHNFYSLVRIDKGKVSWARELYVISHTLNREPEKFSCPLSMAFSLWLNINLIWFILRFGTTSLCTTPVLRRCISSTPVPSPWPGVWLATATTTHSIPRPSTAICRCPTWKNRTPNTAPYLPCTASTWTAWLSCAAWLLPKLSTRLCSSYNNSTNKLCHCCGKSGLLSE